MADNVQRSRGRGSGYKFDRGGQPTEFGPFIGTVRNNIDPTRTGRLQVYIEQFAGDNPDDESLWRTVSYAPPFYGYTPHSGTNEGAGTFTGNQQSYGMWFTPPDLDSQVICFFVAGDPNQGYWTNCVQEPGINHMVPAIGASRKFNLENSPQDNYFAGASQLPVTEINNENEAITEDPRFFDKPKPVHSYLAGVMMQQGLIKDTVRGPITSNAQRESPSAVFGVSTPGKAIYQGGLNELDIKNKLERGEISPTEARVIARRGGHSIVLDDGNLEGKDTLVRIRTAKGHQITMSDDGDCFYIIHANGQSWLEFGKQGTVDVFSTNSVNVRTQGTINLHADKDINMFAGGAINMKSTTMKFQGDASVDIIGTGKMTLYSKNLIGIKSDGSLALKNTSSGSWDGGAALNFKAGCINLNSGSAAPVNTPPDIKDLSLADTKFVEGQGWTVEFGKLKTIVTRAPTHEPYPYHNQGVASITELSEKEPTDLTEAAAETLEGLDEYTVTAAIDDAAFLEQEPAELTVGSLDESQVTGLLASAKAEVNQPFDEISLDKGIGAYGFSPDQLESSGFLKPGTVQTFLKDPAQLESVLSNPGVWTGKAGVGSLGSLLSDPKLQSLTQNEIMVSALDGLKSAGVVTGNELPKDLASFVQTASKFGVESTVSWVKGLAPPDIIEQINATAKNAQYAVDFVNNKSSELVTGGFRIGGFTGTVERSAVDTALEEIIGDNKIPTPNYSSSLYSSVPNEELVYNEDADDVEIGRIEAERADRGLGTSAPVSEIRTSSASSEINQRITLLNNEIYDLEAVIRGRIRRGQDTSVQEAELANLIAQLERLQAS
jgi:hypothetical protein